MVPKNGAYVARSPAAGKAASSHDGWQTEQYGAPPPPPAVPPPGHEPQAVTLQSVPVSGALAGYRFTTPAIDRIQAAEVGRPLIPIPIPDDEHEGDLPPQPCYSAPVQDHLFIEPKYQVSPCGEDSFAYIPTYHTRAQLGAHGTFYHTLFIDPHKLPPVDFESPPVNIPDDQFERIHDARYPTSGLGKFGWLGNYPLVPLNRPHYKCAYVVALNPAAALWEYTPQLMSLGMRWAMKNFHCETSFSRHSPRKGRA